MKYVLGPEGWEENKHMVFTEDGRNRGRKMKTLPFLLKGNFYLFLKSKHYDKQYSERVSFWGRLGHGVRANGRVYLPLRKFSIILYVQVCVTTD